METISLHDLDENELKGILNFFPEIWKKNSGFFDTGLSPIYSHFGETEDLLIGVHIFTHGNGAILFIILTEYIRESRIATFNINARHITGWFNPAAHKKGEVKLRGILENLTYEQLEEFAVVGQHFEDERIFICPNCSAQYALRVLRVSVDGRTECQNCKAQFYPNELATSVGIREVEEELFICPKCEAKYLLDVLPISEDGRIECLNCSESFDPIELDFARRAASHDS